MCLNVIKPGVGQSIRCYRRSFPLLKKTSDIKDDDKVLFVDIHNEKKEMTYRELLDLASQEKESKNRD